ANGPQSSKLRARRYIGAGDQPVGRSWVRRSHLPGAGKPRCKIGQCAVRVDHRGAAETREWRGPDGFRHGRSQHLRDTGRSASNGVLRRYTEGRHALGDATRQIGCCVASRIRGAAVSGLALRGISKRFGGTLVLDDVSLEIAADELVVVL